MSVEPEDLEFDYDEDEDVLYVVLPGRANDPAITCQTREGHLVRLDPKTYEFVGAEVLAFRERWEGQDLTFDWERPRHHRFWQIKRRSPSRSMVKVHGRKAARAVPR